MRHQRDHAIISGGEIYHYGGQMESIHHITQGQVTISKFGSGYLAEVKAAEYFNSFLSPAQMDEVPEEN